MSATETKRRLNAAGLEIVATTTLDEVMAALGFRKSERNRRRATDSEGWTRRSRGRNPRFGIKSRSLALPA